MRASSEELCFLSVREVGDLYRSRRLSARELVEAHVERVEELDGRLKTYVNFLPEQALAQARAVDEEMGRGEWRGPLHGMPFGLKDLFHTKGIRSEAHSKVMEGCVFPEDAAAVARLRGAGGILLGKQAMGEFAVGSLRTELYDRPRNPWSLEHDTGGSSSGSAAGVAAGLAMAALGTDTGGSIRGPASYCGVVGLKPTYGLVSRHGVVPLSWSLDHCGPITRRVEDAALVLGAIAGAGPVDAAGLDYAKGLTGELKGVVIGTPRGFYSSAEVGVDREVLDAVERALADMEGLGAEVREVEIPSLKQYRMAHTVIMMSEGFALHRDNLHSRARDYADVTWNHLASGGLFTAAEYVQAQRVRSRLAGEFRRALEEVDLVAMPTCPGTAWRIREVDEAGPLEAQNLRAPFDMTGMPAITTPCGFSRESLPIGLQLAARPFDEGRLLNAAHAYEMHSPWAERRPKF